MIKQLPSVSVLKVWLTNLLTFKRTCRKRSHLRNSMFVRGLIMSELTVISIYSNTVLRNT